MLVAVLLQTARKDEAIDECRAALERRPRSPRLLLLLYRLLVEKRDLPSAGKVLEKILECDLAPADRTQFEEELKRLRLAAAEGPKPTPETDPADLGKRLESPDAAVRRDAMRVLWQEGFTGGKLMRMVLDEDETVRLYAVRIIGRSRVPATAAVLEALLFAPAKPEGSVPVRAQAALALGEIGVPAVLPVLVRCVAEEPAEEALRAALRSLRRITGKSFFEDAGGPIPEEGRAASRAACAEWWRDDPTGKQWRRKAAESAGDTGEPGLARYCIPWVTEEDASMRAAALEALARLTGDAKWRDAPTETKEQQAAVLDRAASLLEGK
jgi:HEAT repeat protein